jgi:hypothetical protein
MANQITLEEGAFYVVEFPFTSEHGETERTVALYEDGCFWTTNEAAYDDDGPPPVEDSIFTGVRKIDLWAACARAKGEGSAAIIRPAAARRPSARRMRQ